MSPDRERTFLLAGGGTGGHVFPLVAIAQALRDMSPSTTVVYVGTKRGMETSILGGMNERLELLDVHPIKGGGLRGAARGIASAAASLPASAHLLDRVQPSAILSIGGYAAGPVSLVGRWKGVPLALLEPNSVLGLANQILAPVAKRAYLAFPQPERWFRASVRRRYGVPLRHGFSPVPYRPDPGHLKVLVLGGSQGAMTLNRNVPAAIRMVQQQTSVSLSVVHQTGIGRIDEVRVPYGDTDVRVVPFIDDMPTELSGADLVVARAGASSVAEICAVGRASLLIPYPYAAGNHQLHNARALEKSGAAICVPSDEATPEVLAGHIVALSESVDRRTRMAETAQSLGHPEAARRIAEDLFMLVEGN